MSTAMLLAIFIFIPRVVFRAVSHPRKLTRRGITSPLRASDTTGYHVATTRCAQKNTDVRPLCGFIWLHIRSRLTARARGYNRKSFQGKSNSRCIGGRRRNQSSKGGLQVTESNTNGGVREQVPRKGRERTSLTLFFLLFAFLPSSDKLKEQDPRARLD